VVLDCGTHAEMDGEAAPLAQGLLATGTDE
jgi:hypothetical protein